MKINTDKITGYAEMSAEEKVAALESFEFEADYTGYVKKDLFDKVSSEVAEYKKKWRETLSEKEKVELDEAEKRKEMETRLAELENEKTMSEYKAKFIAQGYDEKLASDTAQAMLEGNMEIVFENQRKFVEQREAQIKEELLKGTPEPPGGNGASGMTKEEFRKLPLTEKNRIAKEDPDFYKSMYND